MTEIPDDIMAKAREVIHVYRNDTNVSRPDRTHPLLSNVSFINHIAAALLSERTASEAALKEARAKLFPYADATEISGMSWNGFYLIGDDKSIKELRRLENRSSQIEIFKAAFDEKVATLEAENARLLAEVERLTKALAESDRQSEKLEALLDPHVSWDDADLTPTKENADAG